MEDSAHSILVMDDERIIRNLAASILSRLGYNVTTCANGEEAISYYKIAFESGSPFFVVIMDLIVYGGMGGIDAANEILRIDPHANLVVCSCCADEAAMENPHHYGFQSSIPKPYTIAQIKESLVCRGQVYRH